MSVNPQRSQDVYRDAGKNVLFLMLSLNRQDQTNEKAAVEETADRLQAIKRSLNPIVTCGLPAGFLARPGITSSRRPRSQRN